MSRRRQFHPSAPSAAPDGSCEALRELREQRAAAYRDAMFRGDPVGGENRDDDNGTSRGHEYSAEQGKQRQGTVSDARRWWRRHRASLVGSRGDRARHCAAVKRRSAVSGWVSGVVRLGCKLKTTSVKRRGCVRTRPSATAAITVLAIFLLTCPSQSSFARYVQQPKNDADALSATAGVGRRARAFVEAALGVQRYVTHFGGLFATARFRGDLYVGGVGTWARVPRTVSELLDGPHDAATDVRLFCAACVAVWLIGWNGGVVRQEWMWRHFTASPGAAGESSSMSRRRLHTAFTALVSHATLPALASDLALFCTVAPVAQVILGRGAAAAIFVFGGAAAHVLGVTAWGALYGGILPAGGGRAHYGSQTSYVPPPWAPPCYTMGAWGGCCVLLGYLASAAEVAETSAVLRRLGLAEGGTREVEFWVFGLQLTAAQLLFLLLAVQATGMCGPKVGSGLMDLGLWVTTAGAGIGMLMGRQ